MNRQQRRAKQKATPSYLRGGKQQIVQQLIRNGITPEDLEKEFRAGYEAGFRDATPVTFKTIYAAVILALKELHGFGQARCARVLTAVDDKVAHALGSEELIEKVWESVGLRLNFEEPFDRIEMREKEGAR